MFDVNMALLGMLNEMPEEMQVKGPVNNRRQAAALARTAKRDVEEMERNSQGTWVSG
jgi:hypothetical protein